MKKFYQHIIVTVLFGMCLPISAQSERAFSNLDVSLSGGTTGIGIDFSTKITDALVSGTPLFMYAPDNLAETKYLQQNRCAFVCTKQQELTNCLSEAIYNENLRKSIVSFGKNVAEKNHNSSTNQDRMRDLIVSVCEG